MACPPVASTRAPLSLGLALICAVLANGCNKPAVHKPVPEATSAALPAPSVATAAAATAPKVDPQEEIDRALSDKLGGYIECINRTDAYVHESYDMLLGSLSPKQQVLPNRWPNLRATAVVRDNCYKAIDEAAKLAPKLDDLEQAASAFRAAVEKLEPTLSEGDRYYHQGDDRDDKGARGRALVKQALTDFEAFLVASKQLRANVEKYNQTLLDNSLARVEKAEGRSLHFLCKKIMAEAKVDLDVFLDEKADTARLETTLDAYKQLDGELRARADKFPQEKERVENFHGLLARGDFVLRDFKETARAVKSGKRADASQARESLLKSYNEMVEESNKLAFKDG
jgi:hypothetical protein